MNKKIPTIRNYHRKWSFSLAVHASFSALTYIDSFVCTNEKRAWKEKNINYLRNFT
jgi:hypothetical protein